MCVCVCACVRACVRVCERDTKSLSHIIMLLFLYREAITEIFHRIDLDDNGFISRQEFDLFQVCMNIIHTIN